MKHAPAHDSRAFPRGDHRSARLRYLGPVATVLASLLLTAGLNAQGLTDGSLRVRVANDSGTAVLGTDITITETATGISRAARVGRSAEFTVLFLPVGAYEIHAERLGYRPVHVIGVAVSPGRHADVVVRMHATLPPVNSVDTLSYQVLAAGTLGGVRQSFPRALFSNMPAGTQTLTELFRLSSQTVEGSSVEGLPPASTGLVVDGAFLGLARYPDRALDSFRAAAFPMTFFRSAEIVTNDVDVEWQGAGGGYLSAHTRSGTRALEVESFGTWGSSALTSSRGFRGPAPDFMSGNLGFFASGPILRDTAHFAFGLEAERIEQPLPRAWELDDALDAQLVDAARTAYALELDSYTRARVRRTDIVSGFARADWQVARRHRVELRVNGAALPSILHTESEAPAVETIEGADLSAAASLASQLTDRIGYEMRVAAESSLREGTLTASRAAAGAFPNVHVIDGGLEFGVPAGSGGRFERSSVSIAQTLHFRTPLQHLKAGLNAGFARYDYTHSSARDAEVFFAGAAEFARSVGTLSSASGPLAIAAFNVPTVGVYLQNTLTPAPGFEVMLGARYDVEQLPFDRLPVNEEWSALTGVSNEGLPDRNRKLSPRLGLRWDIGARNRSTVQLSAGVYNEPVEPGLLAELMSNDGRTQVRRVVGNVNGWLTQNTAGGVVGRQLALVAPRFSSPTTARVTMGISHARPRTAVHLSTAFRRTTHLPRRIDLNVLPGPLSQDQDGRPIYGSLLQQGSLLAAAPGSNRRFTGFDVVSAFSADATSQHWELTAGAEHARGEHISIFGSYTFARTTDDWIAPVMHGSESPFDPALGSAAGSADWANASADFDVPHRLVLGLEARLAAPLRPRLAALYRYRSGRVFTPGFRYGVDANGDGSAGNDPAFVDEEVAGMSDLLLEFDCLRSQIGGFAGRNSCRQPGVHTFDARVALQLARIGGVPAELFVDGLDLLDATVAAPDNALLLIDPARRVTAGSSTGVVTVPFVANPNFGQPLLRMSSGRAIRLGFRLSF